MPDAVTKLADAFWPGGLTIVLPARTTLAWDLGDTGGTVALRMPDDRIALELLAETGPLAVSSANRTGQPAAQTVQEALDQLGDAIDVYLDARRHRPARCPPRSSTRPDWSTTPVRSWSCARA